MEQAVREVGLNRHPARRFQEFRQVLQLLLQQGGVREQPEGALEGHGTFQLVEQLQRMGDVRLRLALEESLVAALARLVAVSTTNLA